MIFRKGIATKCWRIFRNDEKRLFEGGFCVGWSVCKMPK